MHIVNLTMIPSKSNLSLGERLGVNAAIYFDINRRGDLAEHIDTFVRSSSEDRNTLIARGHERAKQFSWERSAEKLSEIYRTILA